MIPLATLTREPLQMLKVDGIGYGAKDTGEMGGGAAASLLTVAGSELQNALRSKLAGSGLRVGDAVITPAFKLEANGVRWVLHIISIIKNTPQGAWCPQPERLREGVCSALKLAAQTGARTVAISALGTGEGRVEPRLAARYMLDGVAAYRQTGTHPELAISFSLPSYRDYEAFDSVMRGG
jgi:O-acetyl-ADP-ribose deacetylase (regulator of RNase III)